MVSQIRSCSCASLLVGDRSGVAFDGGGGSLPGAFEVVLGALELLLGDAEVVAERAAVPARGGVEPMMRGAHDVGVLRRRGLRRGAGRLDRRRSGGHVGQDGVGAGCGGGRLERAALNVARRGLSASCRSRWASASTVGNHPGISQRGVGVGAAGAICRGVDWARVRRWVVAGMSARSTARMASRTSRASATSSLSVTTQSVLCVAAAGGGDVQAAAGGGR